MRVKIEQIIDGKKYDTETATLIASNEYWDGHNHERGGRNTHLYKTLKGNFFLGHSTQWIGELDYIEPISKDAAMKKYETLQEQTVTYKEAFDVEPEEA